MTNETLRDRNANDVAAILESLNKEQLEEVLRRTLKAIVQLEYRELMNENEDLREQIASLEETGDLMKDALIEAKEYIDEVKDWEYSIPSAPDISDFV